jgi:hypothetical protein
MGDEAVGGPEIDAYGFAHVTLREETSPYRLLRSFFPRPQPSAGVKVYTDLQACTGRDSIFRPPGPANVSECHSNG